MLDYRQSDINYHNFLLDTKPGIWFKRQKEETIGKWLKRTAYQGNNDFLFKLEWRERNEYWLNDAQKIAVSVLIFLRENAIERETFEDLCGFELILKGSHDWKLSEIRKLELLLNRKLV
jgi:hypothetical protein